MESLYCNSLRSESIVLWKYFTGIQPDKQLLDIDIRKMITIGIERGNNLEKIEKTSSPRGTLEVKRLKNTYHLVSKANNSKYALTLSNVCDTFPHVTCSYLLHVAINPTVSFMKMEAISKNYPKAMMTSAFAYLIPNKQEEFCSLLKKAHMVHQFEFLKTITGGYQLARHSIENERRLLSDVRKRSQAAINTSFYDYDSQIKFLKMFGVIIENENEFIVTEPVLEAVKAWDEIKKKYDVDNICNSFENFLSRMSLHDN